ncbi:hypothetical protein GCM10010174_68640 [Kutzneria viridogrisea]|uniref:NACHT domain-containing protein n=1 Tax=Kutzneria viridogrisea TaxID=47990 RepID=A0ABR6B8Z4_9PSEU|nr:hypothetical protein [Kutzneria viridogrisea]
MDSDPGEGAVNNSVIGSMHGVQARDIHGDVHIGAPKRTAEWLREYLSSLAQADERHEYSTILDDGPPLADVYVERTAVLHGTADGAPMAAEKLLDEHDSLQVTGEPGVGKSSLLRRIAALAARDPDPGFVPVLITANDLATANSVQEALVAGTVHKTDQVLDSGQLTEMFREPPLPGGRWLVLVDGLDEVVDRRGWEKARRRIRESRKRPQYRFVVASRPTGGGVNETADERERYPTYTILRFTDSKWIEFATRWFTKYGLPDAGARAAELLAEVDRTKLGDLTRIPLTASMICLLHLNNPERRLPDNQSELYERFVALLRSKFPEVDIRAQLHEALSPHGNEAVAAGEHLFAHVAELMEYLAHEDQTKGHAGTSEELVTRAMRWPDAGLPPRVADPDWRYVLEKVIQATGLITVEPTGKLVYLHPTIAEYLAARHMFRSRRGGGPLAACFALRAQTQWPWPDLNVKVFLAANWGRDLNLALSWLLTPWNRQHNAGFVVELVRHGVPVDDKLLAKTVTVLCSMITDVRLKSEPWRNAVEWLRQLDPDELRTRVSSLVATPNLPTDRWFEAVGSLLTLGWDTAEEQIARFLTNSQVDQHAISTLARQLDRKHAKEGFDLLARLVRTTTGEPGNKLAKAMLEVFPERGARALAEELRTTAPDSAGWEDKLVLLDLHAPQLALDGWLALLRASTSAQMRQEALERLAEQPPDHVAEMIREVAEDEGLAGDVRVDVAVFAADRLGDSGALLAGLAIGDIKPVPKARACAEWGARTGETAEAVRRIREIYDGLAKRSESRFVVATALRVLSPSDAFTLLREEIIDGSHKPDVRLRELSSLSAWATASQLVEVANMVINTWPPADAIKALAVFGRKNRAGAAQRLRTLAGRRNLNPDIQLALAKTWRELDRSAADELLRKLADNPRASSSVRWQARALLD